MNKTTKAHLALLGANLFYGAGFTIAKSVMPALIKPNGFILIRVVGATLLFWLSYFGGKNYQQTIEKKDWLRLIACGLFGVSANQLLFFTGLNLTSPIHASLMMLITPILVGLFVAIYYKEKFTKINILGLLLGVCGAALLVSISHKDKVASNPLLGDFFVLLNATSYAIYMVIVKPLMHKYRPIVVIRIIFLIGSIMVLPFGLNDFLQINWQLFTTENFMSVAFIVIGVTFFTYLWNIYALQILSPSIVGAYIYIQPVFAALIAIVFLGEMLTITKLISAVFIFVGVYLVSIKKKA